MRRRLSSGGTDRTHEGTRGRPSHSCVVRSLLTALFVLSFAAGAAATPDLSSQFAGRSGCMLVTDLRSGRVIYRYNPARCAQRATACSTFKVPLAVMAFDRGLIKDATTFRWDGKDQGRDSWNRDQTPTTWMRESVVWVSQILTKQLGMNVVRGYLRGFKYGNQDMSGGIAGAWLPGSGGSLRISADEQVAFLARLWKGSLPASREAQARTRALLPTQTLSDGSVVAGKTGSGLLPGNRDLGWYVGHVVTRSGHEYVFAVDFEDLRPGRTKGPGGFAARDIALKALEGLP